MDPLKKFHNEFKALMEEEDRIVQQRGAGDYCFAYVIDQSGAFDGWVPPAVSASGSYHPLLTSP